MGTGASVLRQEGLVVNSKKVRRLMREHDLQPRRRRRFVATTDSGHDLPVFPNLASNIVPDSPNQLWNGDITYVAVASGFVYVALILDAWSATPSLVPSTRDWPWRHSRLPSRRAGRRADASATRTADRSMPRRATAGCSPGMGWWGR